MDPFFYENPPENVDERDFYTKDATKFELMMNLLHSDVLKAQRIYYCGVHHSIETVSTYENHKQCLKTYTRGLILGKTFLKFTKSLYRF